MRCRPAQPPSTDAAAGSSSRRPVPCSAAANRRSAHRKGSASISSPAPVQACMWARATICSPTSISTAKPAQEVMLQFNDGAWEHRAFWGEDVIPWGTAGSVSRLPMGPLPEAGKWVRLEVEAAKVGLEPGAAINGWAFTQHDGTVYWDKAGIVSRTPQDNENFDSLARLGSLRTRADEIDAAAAGPGRRQGRCRQAQRSPEETDPRLFPGKRLRQDPSRLCAAAQATCRATKKDRRHGRGHSHHDGHGRHAAAARHVRADPRRSTTRRATRSNAACRPRCRRCPPMRRPTASGWRCGWSIRPIR